MNSPLAMPRCESP